MKLIEIDNNLILKDAEDFQIEQILECGQCFHFDKIDDNEYVIIAMNRLLHIKQDNKKVTLYNTNKIEYHEIWEKYFDMSMNYQDIKNKLLEKDHILKEAIECKYGIRILKQEFFETLISFIISQNKQIPHIKQIVFKISEKYGDFLGEIHGNTYYSFPTVEQLSRVTEDELRQCKVGFRAPYILDAVNKVTEGILDTQSLRKMETLDVKKQLLQIKGVGEKIANCVLLFGCGRTESFPVDVWIKRIVEHLYIGKESTKEHIELFAKERFGEYGGYAQQYLFYYGREKNLGK